ncbi:glycosyltransferase [Novosphingobium sp. 1949]|uniref:Glycosyltransferase n=1 Tax=Novosphingobium organovorum TaxID=2930092 RepID=A0ABT0BI04_9SPHN|nr:glycosyltransferase [Novosphingobium organovorum]MCJ2184598.1 glycosyltransferase [Novosphingobium organovorum]
MSAPLLRTAHLLDDLALGGVTRGLAVFDMPSLAGRMTSAVVEVDPAQRLAPRLDANVIMVHFPPRWNALPFLLSLRLRNPRARILQVEHSYTRAWAERHVPRAGRFARLLKLWCALCDEVVCVSFGQARWLRDTARLRRAPSVVYPWGGRHGLDRVGLGRAGFDRAGLAEAPAEAPDARPIRLASYGRFAEQKGFDTLIAAMALLPAGRFTLTLGGFGPDEASLRAAAQGLANVDFAGKVTDLAAFLEPVDLVVIPSRWEAFGQVAAEAKMAARAVLVADVDGLPEQMLSRTWVADCRTPQGIAAGIEAAAREDLRAAGAANRAAMADAEKARIAGWSEVLDRAEAALAKAAPVAGSAAGLVAGRGRLAVHPVC